jgi:peroxiredoxin|tara:strand:+ start:65144 stop:65818 length:675 start_codon:yes stop_codon:yes gene_type:complete
MSSNIFSNKLWFALVFFLFAQVAFAQLTIRDPREYTEVDSEALGTLSEGLGIESGSQAPDATLNSIEDKQIRLSDLWADQNVLLIFYRGGWNPYCNAQIRDISVKHSQFQDRSVLPILVSVDEPDASALLTAAYGVPFPVMSDSDLDAHQAYNVVLQVTDEEYEARAARGVDMEAFSGQDHHAMAVPSSFLIKQGGQLLWSHVDVDFRTRPSATQLLNVVDANL